MTPTVCVAIDERGRVIGQMSNTFTEAITPFLWEKGRYADLQSYIPSSSGWVLKKATLIKGRVIIGSGEYRGKLSLFRLTLPQ